MQSCGSSISGEFHAASWLPPQLRVGECACFCAPGSIVVVVCGAQLPPVWRAAVQRNRGCDSGHENEHQNMPHRSPPRIGPHPFAMGCAYRVWGLFIETPSSGMPSGNRLLNPLPFLSFSAVVPAFSELMHFSPAATVQFVLPSLPPMCRAIPQRWQHALQIALPPDSSRFLAGQNSQTFAPLTTSQRPCAGRRSSAPV